MLIIVVIVIKVSKNKKFAEILDKQGNCGILIDIPEREKFVTDFYLSLTGNKK